MLKTTPLFYEHQLAGAKLVDFSGWHMPLHYGSQIQEHHFVRQEVGLFDVSHMAIVEVIGKQACEYLRYLLANDVFKLKQPFDALYTCMLNHQGGIIDDLIVYMFTPQHYRLVLNAGTRAKDWRWLLEQQKPFEVSLKQREDLAMIAIQGPAAVAKISTLLTPDQQKILQSLRPFTGVFIDEIFYSRTGYTGEDGLEIQVPQNRVNKLWQALIAMGVPACGLGARDTLRLEAGLNLYGLDMDEATTPLESNLAWTVAFEPASRHFIGRASLEAQAKTEHKQLVGLVLESIGVLRHDQRVLILDGVEGGITSGTFSPTLGHAIALARIPFALKISTGHVQIREKKVPVQIVKPPFVRKGKKVYTHCNLRK